MKKIIVLACKTHLQVISSLCIIDEYLSRGEDIEVGFFSLSGRFSPDFINKLRQLELFEFVVQLPIFNSDKYITNYSSSLSCKDLLAYYLTKSASKPKIFRSIRSFSIDNYFLKPRHKKFIEKASDLFIYDPFDISSSITSLTRKECLIHQIDEGIGSYLQHTTEKLKPDYIHLFAPSLSTHSKEYLSKLLEIPKISLNNKRLISWLTSLYPSALDNQIPNKLFCDQTYGEWKDPIPGSFRINLIHRLFRDEKSLFYKPHPASGENYLRKHIIPAVEGRIYSSDVPFEIEILLSKTKPQAIYTINSSSATHWRLMFADDFGIKLTIFESSFRKLAGSTHQSGISDFFDKFVKHYSQQVDML